MWVLLIVFMNMGTGEIKTEKIEFPGGWGYVNCTKAQTDFQLDAYTQCIKVK